MLKKIFLTMAIVLSLIHSGIVVGQDIYKKGEYQLIRSNPDVPLVSSFDVIAMAAKHLPALVYKYMSDSSYERRFYYFSGISVYVGLYPNVQEAENVVLDRLNSFNGYWRNLPQDWVKIGDSAWYNTTGAQGSGVYYISGITFIRKNAVITLSMGPNYGADLRAVAEAIDKDILAGADYLKVEDKISPPVVTSVNLTTQFLREGESAYYSFQASDPSRSALKYFSNGILDEKSNTWRYVASRDLLPPNTPFEGPHAIKCWVVNANNLFSSIKEVTVNF